MNFTELDTHMRRYEESLDQTILPEIYMVARLDGRGFTKFTKKAGFKKPFDDGFRDIMVRTTESLMNCGFRVIYSYTESDEISLLFAPDENTFGRKVRKYNSTLAAQASAVFTSISGEICTFDCRMVPLPTIQNVQDYFSWRQEDSNRNCLNGYCYWKLRENGYSARSATSLLSGKGNDFKNELLFQNGINYNNVPSWQKRGIGIWNEEYIKDGYNPLTGEIVKTTRTRSHVCWDLPLGDNYRELIKSFLTHDTSIDIKSNGNEVSSETFEDVQKWIEPLISITDRVRANYIPRRIGECLMKAGFHNIQDMKYCTQRDLKNVKGIGKKSLAYLLGYLKDAGIEIGSKTLPAITKGDFITSFKSSGILDPDDILEVVDIEEHSSRTPFQLISYSCKCARKDNRLASGITFCLSPSEVNIRR